MRKRFAILLILLLLLVFSGLVLFLRLPPAGAVSVRAAHGEADRELIGGDEGDRAALELLPGERLDLNTADAEELQKLPGIGPALAQAIVDYRVEHGPFSDTEAVMNVPGIGPARYAAIAGSITIEETP